MSDQLLALGAGAIIGLGAFFVLVARRGRVKLRLTLVQRQAASPVHLVVGVSTALATWFITGWTISAAIIGIVAGAVSVAARQRRRRDEQALVEALAIWTDQLRDMLAGSNGLEQTIIATTPHAPAILRQPLERLVATMSYTPLAQALDRFADDVNHPTADFIVSALSTAATRQVRELGVLLGHLSTCARDEARMHVRVWVGRARTRSSVRIIAGVIIVFVGGLAVFSPRYLEPYQTAQGQLVLSLVILTFAGALLSMQRLAALVVPERFVGRRVGGVRRGAQ
ncbi:MAG: type II secretion protein F [Acidimicrobiia bacterium]|nr:type II secretion protein F [Actinomycetota bacterium]NDG77068.1 type II secretion protein F [Acidimicrobiia bacterium]